MRGRVRSGVRHLIVGGWWRTTAAAALLVPAGLAAQDRPAPPAAEAATGRTHTVKRGDTLWDLAQAYLGDAFQWPEIYRLNRDVVEDPHWIYPGEVLRIPGAVETAPAEPEAEPAPQPAPVQEPRVDRAAPTVFAPVRADNLAQLAPISEDESGPTIRAGEILGAPWVDVEGAPVAAGRILGARDLPGIVVEGERARYQVYEQLLVTLPSGSAGAVGDRLIAVARGPQIEHMGQVVVPTAILRVVRPPRNGEAAIAEVVRLFSGLAPQHRLVPFDPAILRVGSSLSEAGAADRLEGRIRWVAGDPVLPTVGNFVLLDVPSTRGVQVGDRFEVFEPRREIAPDAPLRPETPVAIVQVVRTTPQGTTAVVLGQDQPSITSGQRVRRAMLMR